MTDQPAAGIEPLFTVVIPTYNRAPFLRHTLRTCEVQNYERLEVIVSDDGSSDDTRAIVEEASRRDRRIRYTCPGHRVGMRENFEHALRQARPGYVLALGGDDGLLPYGIEGMRDALRDSGLQLLAWPAPIYSYPGVRGHNGQLILMRERRSRVVDSRAFLQRQTLHLRYTTDLESPMFYVKGVASTELVDRVRARSADSRFYRCPTPDGYSGIVLAGEVASFAYSSKPFTLHGLSPSSQGLAYVSNDRGARAASQTFLRDTATIPMHPELASQPYSPLITLMTVDYLLTARDLPGWPGHVPAIDFRQVLLKALAELRHGLYGEQRVGRELSILSAIADRHGLGPFFRDTVRRTRRFRERLPFEGTGINGQAFLLDGKAHGIRNVFDAAYAAHHFLELYANLTPRSVRDALWGSISYRLNAMRKGRPFPPASEWGQ